MKINFLLSLAILLAASSVSAAVLALNLAVESQGAPSIEIPVVSDLLPEETPDVSIEDPRFLEFGILIEKVDIKAPIVANVDGTDKSIYKTALKQGAAHLKGSREPGEGSNVFIYGHSSRVFGRGTYESVFSPLKDTYPGDRIAIYRAGVPYEYEVFDRIIVEPTDVWVANPTPEEQLTLMTCWPIGTAKQRLIIKAHPVSSQALQT